MEYRLTTPLTREALAPLRKGDLVYLSGVIYTARDAAHNRLVALAREGKELPFPIENATIYYVGPTPAKPGQVIGSAGPTTSYRMDAYSPTLIALGETGMIGKGRRSQEVIDAMKAHGAVYFGAIGGAGALLARCIKKAEIVRSAVWRWRICPWWWSSTVWAATCTRPAGPTIWASPEKK